MLDAFKVLSEPRRLEILRLVWDRERCAGDLAGRFEVSFSAVSQHLARLRQAGLVTQRRDGRKRWYRANREALGPLAQAFEALWRERLARLKALAEAEEAENADVD